MRRIWNKRMVGQREENGKGARSQPVLMQIVATLKGSREAEKVLFNGELDKHRCKCTHALRETEKRGKGSQKTERRGTRKNTTGQKDKIPPLYLSCALTWTLW